MDMVHILLLEHNPVDAGRTIEALTEYGHDPEVVRAATAEEFRAGLVRQPFDVIVADHGLAAAGDITALDIAREIAPMTPFIFIGGTPGGDHTIEALNNGASDYVPKRRLGSSVARALRDAHERAEYRLAATEAARATTGPGNPPPSAKDRSMATLGHELRVPLTPALASVYALEEMHGMPDSARVLIDSLRRNLELEARLVDDFLDLTHISEGILRLDIQPVDTHAIIDAVMKSCRAEIESRELQVVVAAEAAQNHVMADPERLRQIVLNLVTSAAKLSAQGGTITIRTTSRAPDCFMLDVCIGNCGIDPEFITRAFDTLERRKENTSRTPGGLGLKFAVTKALVDLHNGHLIARNNGAGRGATLTLELAAVASRPAATITKRPTNTMNDSTDAERLRILIVDDHDDTRRVIQMLLERRGYSTLTATSVAGALEVAAANDFDLLISDIGLPDGTGVDLIRALTANGRSVKAIALSGYGMEEDIRRSKDAGFYEHLTKPVSIKKLQDVIDALVGKGDS